MLIPYTFPLFKILIPYAIILSFAGILAFHNFKNLTKTIILFSLIFIAGYLIEVAGVKTGLIFGKYTYGRGLGFKLFETPILIGLNWVFMVYTSSSVVERLKIHYIYKIIIASIIMIIYDIMLEQVAPILDMWSWEASVIPLQNYLSWFILALIFNSLVKIFRVNMTNKLSLLILIAQFLFFFFIFLFYKIII